MSGTSIQEVLDHSAATPRPTRAVRSALAYVLLFALCWIGLYALYLALPNVRPGADLVTEAKDTRLATSQLFAPGDRNRVVIFGTSRILAGFRPDIFDKAIGPGTKSYNFGLPGNEAFLPTLRKLLEAGNRPTHVLLTARWDERKDAPSVMDLLHDDKRILHILVPFRELPRDLVVFAMTDRHTIRQRYAESGQIVDQMLANRGWYFIRSQSHFANDSLPADFRLPTDRPGERLPRQLPQDGWVLRELAELGRQYGFRTYIVPDHYRRGSYAVAPARAPQALSTAPAITVLGPDYFLYPAPSFADPVHLNPKAAITYSRDLATLMKQTGAIR